jgi:predicted amidohydrolase
MHANGSIRAVLMQLDLDLPFAPAARVREIAARVARLRDADLVVLPELWSTGYFAFDDYRANAEPLAGPFVEQMAEAAREAGVVVVAGTFLEVAPDGVLHNTAVVLGADGELLLAQRKYHVFGLGSREAELVAGGEDVAVADTAVGRIAVAVCYDLRFPELFRLHSDGGAELIVVPAAWPAARREHWRLLARARAVENQAFVLACNGAGRDHGTPIAGYSAVVDPLGEVVAEADERPGTIRVTLERAAVAATRAAFPVLADRRLTVGRPQRRPAGAVA